MTILREREVGDVSLRRRVAEVLVRKVPDNQQVERDLLSPRSEMAIAAKLLCFFCSLST